MVKLIMKTCVLTARVGDQQAEIKSCCKVKTRFSGAVSLQLPLLEAGHSGSSEESSAFAMTFWNI